MWTAEDRHHCRIISLLTGRLPSLPSASLYIVEELTSLDSRTCLAVDFEETRFRRFALSEWNRVISSACVQLCITTPICINCIIIKLCQWLGRSFTATIRQDVLRRRRRCNKPVFISDYEWTETCQFVRRSARYHAGTEYIIRDSYFGATESLPISLPFLIFAMLHVVIIFLTRLVH